MDEIISNNQALRNLWVATGLTHDEALVLVNKKQARPIAMSTWKAYMAGTDTVRRRACPDGILAHAVKVLKGVGDG